ncbi:MAG: hypothetical protein M1824_003971 [Vezdaea acicularis]|nr:MAG: hypothetical protein M1824_003971 [Vezdaea acicularis]
MVLVFWIAVSRIGGVVAVTDKDIICFGEVPSAWASTHSFRGSGRLLYVPEIVFHSLSELCGFDQLFNLKCAADGKAVVALKTRARSTLEHFAQMGSEVQMGPVPYGTYLAEAQLVEQVQEYCLEHLEGAGAGGC